MSKLIDPLLLLVLGVGSRHGFLFFFFNASSISVFFFRTPDIALLKHAVNKMKSKWSRNELHESTVIKAKWAKPVQELQVKHILHVSIPVFYDLVRLRDEIEYVFSWSAYLIQLYI